ncbi:transcriptional regulator [Brevibacillus agri]|jgi:DNA-binding MarR family transcriptional regulator|uniref:Transcriptional regulator n=1 Tax=Brevibacillus agri TaxID=51101 RepID=A0A3M8BDC7_9BACL|nr:MULTISPECIES: MarR family transcriptional regulator [Brevibacillus]ELK40988.1 MarR family transcriptional regulator [Brevibacillus agri BAB-2500]EJL46009.1 transcriptional regulator [Brevibacillus sp. CF112]MBG9566402.1 MarR family transcriptional regulator [Brevibacillus agri]MBY0054858.1 MarR family transcriptional regulator [Brevibacillus agri]MCG5253508.1 MarR family transcriptional regulator [Brevibacillus agri]
MSSDDRQHPALSLTPIQQELLQEIRTNSSRAVMFHQMISEKLGLNATDHKCLDFLYRSGPVTAGQLAELTGLTTGAVTNVIDRLEQAGYVVRAKDPKDRRKVVVKPTDHGPDNISPLFDSILHKTIALLDRYTEQETRVILDFLKSCNAISLEEMNKQKEAGS